MVHNVYEQSKHTIINDSHNPVTTCYALYPRRLHIQVQARRTKLARVQLYSGEGKSRAQALNSAWCSHVMHIIKLKGTIADSVVTISLHSLDLWEEKA